MARKVRNAHRSHTQSEECPVDQLIEETIVKHAEESRARKEREERVRLGPRTRVAKAIFKSLKREIMGKQSASVHLTDKKLAEVSEEAAKMAIKASGLEPHHKKDKD